MKLVAKKLISLILSLIIIASSFAGAFSAYAEYVEVATDCIKILLVGNSYTYYNGLDQMLCGIGNATDKDLLVVSAVNSGSDADNLLKEEISYYAWYDNKRIEKGTDTLARIAKIDFGGIDRSNSWDYVVLQNNTPAENTAISDAHMLAFFSDKLESNKNFIIHSNYWINSLKKDRHKEHYAFAEKSRASLIDTRGIFAQYNKIFNKGVWFRDLTSRDSRNHPAVWGTYIFALSIYAKIFGTAEFPKSVNDENIIPFYNSDLGTIKEILNTGKFKNDYTVYDSITKADATRLQYLVGYYAPYYIGGSLQDGDGSIPKSSCFESIKYTSSDGTKLNGWKKLDGNEYLFSDGSIVTNCMKQYGSKTYYIDMYGEKHNGWLTYKNNRYYLLKDGSIAKGLKKLKCDDGKTGTFYFGKNGALATGTTKIGSKTYYFSNGRDNKQKGIMYKACWHIYTDTDGVTYRKYYDKNGVMVKGFCTIKGKKYYFNKKGNLRRGSFFRIGKATYCADENGIIQQNKIVLRGGVHYYFGKDGKMAKKRIVKYKGSIYRASRTGALKKLKAVKKENSKTKKNKKA